MQHKFVSVFREKVASFLFIGCVIFFLLFTVVLCVCVSVFGSFACHGNKADRNGSISSKRMSAIIQYFVCRSSGGWQDIPEQQAVTR